MVIPSLIQHKRDGGALRAEDWTRLVAEYTAGRVPDYQMSALLMAVFFRGLTTEELAALTDAMLESGDRLRFDGYAVPRVDKHSTGGVGDKVSLLLAPMVACCGVAVPMMSGRGLGHTGGTLDKLEAIPGFRTGLSLSEARAQVERIGCAMLGQTPEIAPADRRLYALRDVTATVESIPLIAASIMSKKLAEGLNGLVLDVKTGSGAFLPEPERALELARTMIALGEARGCPTVALLTAMDRPLGRACGNALEVEEAIEGLSGRGPGRSHGGDLRARRRDAACWSAPRPDRRRAPAGARGGGGRRPGAREVRADHRSAGRQSGGRGGPVRAAAGGRGRGLPRAARRRGRGGGAEAAGPGDPRAGRRPAHDGGRPWITSVGFVITAKPGDRVREGEPIASIFARDAEGIAVGQAALREAIRIAETGTAHPADHASGHRPRSRDPGGGGL